MVFFFFFRRHKGFTSTIYPLFFHEANKCVSLEGMAGASTSLGRQMSAITKLSNKFEANWSNTEFGLFQIV